MKAQDTLKTAASLVSGDRAKQHGDMFHSHDRIARFWSAYIGSTVNAHNVACMMALLKCKNHDFG